MNANDPTGLLPFLLPFAVGMAGDTAIGGTGAYSAAKATDWLGRAPTKNSGKGKPTKDVHDAMNKVIGINTGIVGAAGAVKMAPGAAARAIQHPYKLAAGSMAAGDFANGLVEGPPPQSPAGVTGAFTKGAYDWHKRNRR